MGLVYCSETKICDLLKVEVKGRDDIVFQIMWANS